jgi:hypothetical protein
MLLVSGIFTVLLLHIEAVDGLVNTGLGFTVRTTVVLDEQPFAVTVKVNVVVC